MAVLKILFLSVILILKPVNLQLTELHVFVGEHEVTSFPGSFVKGLGEIKNIQKGGFAMCVLCPTFSVTWFSELYHVNLGF